MRQDSVTGEEISEGYLIESGMFYAANEENLLYILLTYYKVEDLEEAFEEDLLFCWTTFDED